MKLAAVFVLALTAAAPAIAADLELQTPQAVLESDGLRISSFSWAGPYIGGHAGYGRARLDGFFDSDDATTAPGSVIALDDLDPDGPLAGVHAGWNYLRGSLMVGIEADGTLARLDGEAFEPDGADERAEAEIDFLASLRLRAGIAADRLLFYVTAGGAYVRSQYSVVDDIDGSEVGGPFPGSEELDQYGYVAGAGVEWAVRNNISLRAEALYYFFGDTQGTSHLLGPPGPFESDPEDFVELQNVFTVRGGASVHF